MLAAADDLASFVVVVSGLIVVVDLVVTDSFGICGGSDDAFDVLFGFFVVVTDDDLTSFVVVVVSGLTVVVGLVVTDSLSICVDAFVVFVVVHRRSFLPKFDVFVLKTSVLLGVTVVVKGKILDLVVDFVVANNFVVVSTSLDENPP